MIHNEADYVPGGPTSKSDRSPIRIGPQIWTIESAWDVTVQFGTYDPDLHLQTTQIDAPQRASHYWPTLYIWALSIFWLTLLYSMLSAARPECVSMRHIMILYSCNVIVDANTMVAGLCLSCPTLLTKPTFSVCRSHFIRITTDVFFVRASMWKQQCSYASINRYQSSGTLK